MRILSYLGTILFVILCFSIFVCSILFSVVFVLCYIIMDKVRNIFTKKQRHSNYIVRGV